MLWEFLEGIIGKTESIIGSGLNSLQEPQKCIRKKVMVTGTRNISSPCRQS